MRHKSPIISLSTAATYNGVMFSGLQQMQVFYFFALALRNSQPGLIQPQACVFLVPLVAQHSSGPPSGGFSYLDGQFALEAPWLAPFVAERSYNVAAPGSSGRVLSLH